MSFARPLFLNRIGGQITVLIVLSLLAIHTFFAVAFYLTHRGENRAPPDEGPSQFISAVKLVAAAAPDERGRALAQIARAFPHLRLAPTASMPAPDAAAGADPRLRFLAQGLGAGFQLAALPAAPGGGETADGIAVRLPDGDILTARIPPPPEPPPPLGGPIAVSLLFILVSVTLLGLWATRALRRPLSGFAAAAEGFDLDGDVAALPERGPEEVRAVAKAFNSMRARIRKLVDDRTRMLAAMGHDLRTPITRLRLRCEFIADKDLRRQTLRDLDQMKAMTDSVLSFLRDGQTGERATAVDLASLLQTVCDQFADMGHDVTYRGPDRAPLTARPHDLQRAVANLVDNAVRHGTRAVVRLAIISAGATVDVEDDGPGIAGDRKEVMLQAFVRGEEARTMDDRAGFGLGLSIARAIAEAHGGTLSLHDRTPRGLIARITLPRFTAAPDAH